MFNGTLLCFGDSAFLTIEGLWQPSVEQVYQHNFSNSICLLCVSHILVIEYFNLFLDSYGDL